MNARPEAAQKRTKLNAGQGFDRLIQSQASQMQQQAIEQLVQDITKQGDRLARFRSFQDLAKFKRLVKGFLKETLANGLDVEKSRQFDFGGGSRELTLIRTVDEKLTALTEEMMNQEKKTVDLLGLIGEIKGLLVNLYR
jgi:uncharacterized protein YaaR (DUF327 family)